MTLDPADQPSVPPMTIPPPGALIDGTYRVLSSLGEGGMGAVLLAHDENLDRRVAIKVIRPAHLHNGGAVSRFLSEARAMARVHHPNVVQIFAFGSTSGAPYLVMEYVPGKTLETWFRENIAKGPLPVDTVLGMLDPICRGVEAIHRGGTVHRDLKPGNVLVGPAFRLAVTDFGLARLFGQPLRPRAFFVSGTPAYMAPELSSETMPDGRYASRADVYSLGVIAFELLTGRLPFVASTLVEMVQLHTHAKVPLASAVRTDLPAALDDVLVAALAKNPAERTPTAEALRLALQGASTRPAKIRRALVADDDPGYRDLVTRILARAFPGCVVESVPDGTMALASVDRATPDLAVIDLDMPGLNGIELTASIRARAAGAAVPIICATGVSSGSDWDLLQTLGVDGIVTKPFDPAQLVTLARALVGSSGRTHA
ncbi:MAG: protein kinase [Deltaproteobacteria bacterium]|nr:protein kinase [Deltaproteobacteria bacterium]